MTFLTRLTGKPGGLSAAILLTIAGATISAAEEVVEATAPVEVVEESPASDARPPYRGTIYVAPDIYLESDPTALESVAYVGRGVRQMFDRRENRRVANNAHLFKATFSDGLSLEVRINPEFHRDLGEELAQLYMTAFGQLPTELRRDMESFDIHDGDRPFGGGGRNVLVHVRMGERYLEQGILTETLFHETVHATIDRQWRRHPSWLKAQDSDPLFISTYAENNPSREDLAETLLLCIAIVERPERLPRGMDKVLQTTIPNRIRFFEEELGWNIDPTTTPVPRIQADEAALGQRPTNED